MVPYRGEKLDGSVVVGIHMPTRNIGCLRKHSNDIRAMILNKKVINKQIDSKNMEVSMLDSKTFAFCLENFTDTPENHPPSSLRCFFNERTTTREATVKPSWLSEFALTGWFQINLKKTVSFVSQIPSAFFDCVKTPWKSYHLPDVLLFFLGGGKIQSQDSPLVSEGLASLLFFEAGYGT